MLGDVGEPQLVDGGGGELVPLAALVVGHDAQVVVDRRAGPLAVLAALLAERAPPALLGADPPCGPLGHRLTSFTCFVDQEAVAELRVVPVSSEQGACAVGLLELGIGDRVDEPAVVGLASDLEHPARHRDGDPVFGQLADERVHHFPGRFACER